MVAGFKVNDYCVYRTHGIAKVIDIQHIKIGEFESKCYILFFEREKLTLTVPFRYKDSEDLRKIASMEDMDKIFEILKNSQKKVKGMWSRRAKEYEEKINSGNIFFIAEVLQDLIRDVNDADRSYSERIIYETAIYRLASEYAIIRKISYEEAEKYILDIAKEKVSFVNIKNSDLEDSEVV